MPSGSVGGVRLMGVMEGFVDERFVGRLGREQLAS